MAATITKLCDSTYVELAVARWSDENDWKNARRFNKSITPTFVFLKHEGLKWHLGYSYCPAKNSMKISLCLESTDQLNFQCVLKVSATNKKSEEITSSNCKLFKSCNEELEVSLCNADNYVIGSKFKLHFEVRLLLDAKSIRNCWQGAKDLGLLLKEDNGDITLCVGDKKLKAGSPVDNKPHPASLMKDLGRLLAEKSGDVSLCVGDNTVKVHKTIVMARSPLLAAILVDQQQHHFQDLDLDVVQALVRYMYTDHVDNITNNAKKLYPLACKFALLGLKELCEETMVKSLTVDNAVEIIIIADSLSTDFKARVVEFMKKNFTEIKATTGFKAMVSTHPHLFMEMALEILEVDATPGAHRAA